MTKRYFSKLTVVAHQIQVNDDESIDELITPENTIKDEQEAIKFIAMIRQEIGEFNVANSTKLPL